MADGRALLGAGMAGRAADDLRLAKVYRSELIAAQDSGASLPPYEEWKQQYLAQADADMKVGFDSVRRK